MSWPYRFITSPALWDELPRSERRVCHRLRRENGYDRTICGEVVSNERGSRMVMIHVTGAQALEFDECRKCARWAG